MSLRNCIKVYARLKPIIDDKKDEPVVKYNISLNCKKCAEDLILESPDENELRHNYYKFRFHKIIDTITKQETVFEDIVQPVVDSVLNGYNGTVLAYGQTGSGKTYTMTGSTEIYEERGLIPRTIQYLFSVIKNTPNVIYSVYVSYFEIYNECGYDLLDEKQATKLEDLQRVIALEDCNGNIHLRNLSVHPINSETEALKMLFIGDRNRSIAETPMNPFSTRSHCIFTIHLGIRRPKCKSLRRGKLHLVDLAGSERLNKTNLKEAKTINEAKSINLSLHYLEQVISALSESKRQHVPYRNSLLTSVLRDSLGGNCLTIMIATLSLYLNNYMETISTCRFAQRVALINNEIKMNEEIDPHHEILHLKAEVIMLKSQLSIYMENDVDEELTDIQQQKCKEAVVQFVKDNILELEIEPDIRQIRYCFNIFKSWIQSYEKNNSICTDSSSVNVSEKNSSTPDTEKTLEIYKDLIRQRDNEISILINLLRKEKENSEDYKSETPTSTQDMLSTSSPTNSSDEFSTASNISSPRLDTTFLDDNEKIAFEIYSNKLENNEQVRIYQNALQEKMTYARKLAAKIDTMKKKIIHIRKKIRLLQDVNANLNDIYNEKKRFTEYRKQYKDNIQLLRELKKETEILKDQLENANIQMMNRFKICYHNESLQEIPCRENDVKTLPAVFVSETNSSDYTNTYCKTGDNSPRNTPYLNFTSENDFYSSYESLNSEDDKVIYPLPTEFKPPYKCSSAKSNISNNDRVLNVDKYQFQSQMKHSAKSNVSKTDDQLKPKNEFESHHEFWSKRRGLSVNSNISTTDNRSNAIQLTPRQKLEFEMANDLETYNNLNTPKNVDEYQHYETQKCEPSFKKNSIVSSDHLVKLDDQNSSDSHEYQTQTLIPISNELNNEVEYSDNESHDEQNISDELKTDIVGKLEKFLTKSIADSENTLEICENSRTLKEEEKQLNFEEFVKTLPLTGDEEVDREIIDFYRSQFGL